MPIKFTRKGRHRLSRDGVFLSEHNVMEEAYENAFEDAELGGNAVYRIDPAWMEFTVPITTIVARSVAGAGVFIPPPVDETPPTNVTNPTATAVSTSQINVNADAASDPESGVTGYDIEVSDNGTTGWTSLAVNVVLPYPHGQLAPSTAKHYRLKAVNGVGLRSSSYSSVATDTTDAVPGAPGGWQLAAGHFIPAKMAPQIIFPRTDAEMNAWARPARAPSGIPWRVPIEVQGGAWPFHFELTTGPVGMVVGADLDHAQWNGASPLGGTNDAYGEVSWSNPTVGSHPITVTVTDQDGTVVVRSWTLEVIDRENTTYFMFVDNAEVDNSGTGAFSDPKKNFMGWYRLGKNDNTDQTKQIFYRTGTYNISGVISTDLLEGTGTSLDSKFGLSSQKPHVHVTYPGETVTFDNNNQAFWDWQSGQDDAYFEGMNWQGCTVTENGANRKTHVRFGTNAHARTCLYRVRFIGDDLVSGTGSNPACFMFAGNPDPGSYFAISRCHFQNCDNMDFGLFYDTSDVVCEYNTTSGGYESAAGGSAGGFFFKANHIERVTVRANVQLANDGGTYNLPFLYFSQFTTGVTDERNDIEFCWNRVRNNSTKITGEGAGAVGIGQSVGAQGNHYGSFWSYRNSMHNPHISMIGLGLDDRDSSVPGPFTFQNDVIHHSGTYTDGIYELNNHASVDPVKTNLATGTSLLTSTLLLATGSPRDTYFGTHGSEVA